MSKKKYLFAFVILIILSLFLYFNKDDSSHVNICSDGQNNIMSREEILRHPNLQSIEKIEFEDYITPENKVMSLQKKILKEHGLTLKDANLKMAKLKEEAMHYSSKTQKIPKTWHKSWLTNPNNPCLIPHEIIVKISVMCELFPEWDHFIWTNVSGVVLDSFKKNHLEWPKNLSERNITELKEEKLYPVIQSFIDLKGYSYAADVLRPLVVYLYGGGYADIGWIVSNHAYKKMINLPYIIIGHGSGIISIQILCAYPKSKLLKKMVEWTEKSSELNISNIITYKGRILKNTGPQAVTGWVPIILDAEHPIFLLSGKYLLPHWNRSHIKGKFGSTKGSDISSLKLMYQVYKNQQKK